MERLVQAILSSPSNDVEKSRRIFEVRESIQSIAYLAQYMSTRMGLSAASAMDRLQAAPFIPVKIEKDVRLYRPSEVYFSATDGNADLYRTAFTFVDFGDRANSFLRYCGVRSEPSVKGEPSVPPH